MATYGGAGQPAQSTFNYDALVATSLANYRKTLQDEISTSNVVFFELNKRGLWESRSGGLYIAEDLMYALSPMDSYSGYDVLPLTPTEGITQAQFDWRQVAGPISISGKEEKQNKQRIISLLDTKLKQATLGMQEGFAKHFLQGSLAGSGSDIRTPYTSPSNGSQSIDSLASLIRLDYTASATIGGINQNTYSWWRNNATESAATTMTAFLTEIDHMYNLCSRGPGGPPTVIWTDQTTYELLTQAYFLKHQFVSYIQDQNFPFEGLKYKKAYVVWDEFMCDPYSNSYAGAANTSTYGVMYFLNPQFMKIVYESETNFVSTPFQKPVNQDAKFCHILWMGNTTISNRRKFGVIGKIPRTLTAS